MYSNLGTRLRHLIELLDGAVGEAYEEAALVYRPRFTPVMRALMQQEPCTIGQIAQAAGITQPAATQTVALMVKEGLVSAQAAQDDARQRLIRLTRQGRALLPRLQDFWLATSTAARTLDAELETSLVGAVEAAIQALQAKPFAERIREARTATKRKTPGTRRTHARTP